MLIFDELKKNDPHLRLVAMMFAGGLFILLAGLWWVQVVSARKYQSHLETQAYRSVRIPAARGKILDRAGRVLAENRPSYNLNIYLDDLQKQFDDAYKQLHKQALAIQKQAIAAEEKKLGHPLTKAERKQFALTTGQLQQLHKQAQFNVASAVVAQVGQKLGQPIAFDAAKFNAHYVRQLAMPFTLLPDLDTPQIARFEENYSGGLGANLKLQSGRAYPYGSTAAHLLGYLRSDDSSIEGEDAFFNYRLPDYRGVVGIEGGFDAQLHGRAGAESVLVNSLGYRQSENIWNQPEPGRNVVLTIDLDIQRAAENSLARRQGATARAAIVVMDVHSGDVLAMVSSPAINPVYSENSPAYLNNTNLCPQINRATQQNYAPGSIFKPIIALAALEKGLDPEEIYEVQPDPTRPGRGCIYVGNRKIDDTVTPGAYNFKRALELSSNAYFVTNGLRAGIDEIIGIASKFHFGQSSDLPTKQNARGNLPSLQRVKRSGWHDGDTANVCIGQGEISVTPLQMAVAYSAIANGGTVLRPRLVERIELQNPASGEAVTNFPSGLARGELGVHPRSLRILHDAMLAETEDAEGTGHSAVVPGLRICGKTGTAQVMNERNQVIDHTTWFASFAPYENPKYAVVVMVESGASGGITCAPIAHDIYETILKKENTLNAKVLAQN